MNPLKKAKNKLADLMDSAQAIVDACGEDGFTDEQREKFDGIQGQIEVVKADIARLEAIEAVERPSIVATPAIENDPMYGFSNMADFAAAVYAAGLPRGTAGHSVDERLLNIQGATHTTATGEGFMIPPQLREQIWELVFMEPSIANLMGTEPTSSNSVEYNKDETTPWGSTGVQAYWRGENTQMTESNLDTDPAVVKLHELYAFCTATEELLADAPRLNDRLTRQAARAINWKRDQAIIEGDGVGKPTGILGHASTVTVAKESGQAADTVVAKNIGRIRSRQLNLTNCFWLTRSEVEPELWGMTVGDQPVWTAPNQYISAPGGILGGRPVYYSEHAEALGDVGDLTLISPDGYYAVQKGDAQFDSSIHLYFDYNKTAFRWVFRFGGEPILSGPVAANKGSATKSYFVNLAARA